MLLNQVSPNFLIVFAYENIIPILLKQNSNFYIFVLMTNVSCYILYFMIISDFLLKKQLSVSIL